MKIALGPQTARFSFWTPSQGCVFKHPFAFDTETTLIDENFDFLAPAYVLGAAFDGRRGYFVSRQHLAAFLTCHRRCGMVMHNAPFDLDVIHNAEPALDVYRQVDNHRVWDTLLLHQLLELGTKGRPPAGRGASTLEMCAQRYAEIQLPKDVTDANGAVVRLSYGRWLGVADADIEPVYLEYLAKDAMATHAVYRELRKRLKRLQATSSTVWGFQSDEWHAKQIKRHGPQTHHIQLKAAIVLRAITQQGLCIAPERRDELKARLEERRAHLSRKLAKFDYVPNQPGSGRSLQRILARLASEHPELHFPRTATGKFSTAGEVLETLSNVSPFLADLREFKHIEKLLSTFVGKMNGAILHPSFRTLVTTGRTSSFGAINAQNLPRDDSVRACFVPPSGHVFVNADYKTIELAALAQALQSQFETTSHMAAAINRGEDLHRLVAAEVTGKPIDAISAEDRQRAKAINFGLPGGMSAATLRLYAKENYGVAMDEETAEDLIEAWFQLFPEMNKFLESGDRSTFQAIARFLQLTPSGYYEATDRSVFLDYLDDDAQADQPHEIIGAMARKAFAEPHACTGGGRSYSDSELAYFWGQLEQRIGQLPKNLRKDVEQRRPSPKLSRAVVNAATAAPVMTLTGRIRANAYWCARHNTIFQGLAADGAKLAMWRLWRAGYRIANFVHDEFLIVVPDGARLQLHAEVIKTLMIEGMREVIPDVAIDIDYNVSDRWSKHARCMRDATGRLIAWTPALA